MAIKFLFADEFHIHERNFPTLFQFIEKNSISFKYLLVKQDNLYELIRCHGQYDLVLDQKDSKDFNIFIHYLDKFKKLSSCQLYNYKLYEINLFETCRMEMLSLLITQDNWCEVDVRPDNQYVFNKAFQEDRQVLLMNMAAAAFWLTTWMEKFQDIHAYHCCFVFSGSCIYTRTLMEILRRTSTKCYVLESTFTGNDYLCEELYQPLPNNSSIQFRALRQKLLAELPALGLLLEKEIIKAKSKMVNINNKNVVQPPSTSLKKFLHNAETVLLIGQVVNDFSILLGKSTSLSSIYIYKHLIYQMLKQTEYNIIIKTHPWENKKVHLTSPFTRNKLSDFLKSLPQEFADRVLLVEHENLYNLFELSNYVLTLCSQSGLEAALEGFKPIILGKAFYSHAGFTSDYSTVESLVAAMVAGQCNNVLTLEEYRNFELFITSFFQRHTISVHDSGISTLKKLFTPAYVPIEQAYRQARELETKPKWLKTQMV
jgi:hypothetical protein